MMDLLRMATVLILAWSIARVAHHRRRRDRQWWGPFLALVVAGAVLWCALRWPLDHLGAAMVGAFDAVATRLDGLGVTVPRGVGEIVRHVASELVAYAAPLVLLVYL